MSDDKGDTKESPISLTDVRSSKAERQRAELLSSIAYLMDNMEDIARMYEVQAELAKRRYDAYIDAGFEPQQALELIKDDK